MRHFILHKVIQFPNLFTSAAKGYSISASRLALFCMSKVLPFSLAKLVVLIGR